MQMLNHECGTCRAPLHPSDEHNEPVWGKPTQNPHSLMLAALTARVCLPPLCARGLLSFQKVNPPLTLSCLFSPRSLRGKKTVESSEFTPAQILCASLSPHREISLSLVASDRIGRAQWMTLPPRHPKARATELGCTPNYSAFSQRLSKSWDLSGPCLMSLHKAY